MPISFWAAHSCQADSPSPSLLAERPAFNGFASALVAISRNVDANLVDGRAPSNVESLVVGVAKRHVCKSLGNSNGAQVLALRRDDPQSAGTR